MSNSITQDELKASYYVKTTNPAFSHLSHYISSWQKQVSDNDGVKFNIKYDFFKNDSGKKAEPTWQAEASLKMGDNDFIPVQYIQNNKATIQDVEKFFDNMFENIGAKYLSQNSQPKIKIR